MLEVERGWHPKGDRSRKKKREGKRKGKGKGGKSFMLPYNSTRF
jgi:hypothetical protein